MKQLILVIIFICNVSIFAQQYWLPVNSPVTKTLNKAHFIDTVFGWAAGDSGTIVHTSNSGVNWVQQSTGITTYPIEDIYFINQRIGWAVSNDFFFAGSTILKTSNGGLNWSGSRYPDTTLVFSTIYFIDSLNGFLSGFTGEIYKTTNAGFNWFNTHIDTAYCALLYLMPKNRFYFVNASTGFACGGQIDIQGMIWKTTDGGLNWFTHCVASEPLYDIKVVTSDKVIATGGDYEYGLSTSISTNSGDSWRFEVNNVAGRGYSLAFRIPSEVWVPLNFSRTFAINLDTANFNTPWYVFTTPDSVELNSIKFLSPTFGWAFGSGGSIYKYNTAVIGINNGQSEVIPENFTLRQNYPNPFNPSTTIGYDLLRAGLVKIEIFNSLGELTEVLLNSYQPAGYHNVEWNTSGHASGLYLCRVSSGNMEKTIKMVLIR